MHDADPPDRTPRDAFATRAVHAGAEPDEADRRRLAADLPDVDVRPGRRRAAARRLRVRPQPEPDPRAARARGRGPRGRPPRHRLRERVGDDGGHRPARRRRATRSSSATTSTAARTATSSACTARRARARRATSTSRAARTRCGRALTERTRLVWFETPSNPLLKVTDIAASAATVRDRAAQAGRARPLLVVDNTFASPALQRPLELGADIVFHSATKYLGGHSDAILGIAVTTDDAVAERLRFLQNAMGGVPGPVRLLPRAARAPDPRPADGAPLRQRDGRRPVPRRPRRRGLGRLPGAGRGPPRASRPRDRGAPDAPRRRRRRSAAWSRSRRPPAGGTGDRRPSGRVAVCEAIRLFTLGESLGSVESLIEVPAAMTHLSVAESALAVDPRSCGCRSGSRPPTT